MAFRDGFVRVWRTGWRLLVSKGDSTIAVAVEDFIVSDRKAPSKESLKNKKAGFERAGSGSRACQKGYS